MIFQGDFESELQNDQILDPGSKKLKLQKKQKKTKIEKSKAFKGL